MPPHGRVDAIPSKLKEVSVAFAVATFSWAVRPLRIQKVTKRRKTSFKEENSQGGLWLSALPGHTLLACLGASESVLR